MVVTTIDDIKRFVKEAKRNNKSVGFVPTMGFLHEGHLSLIRRAKSENNFVVVSIFVNPTQFGPSEDFETYPRDLAKDTVLAVDAGADVIFNPSVETMYSNNNSSWVTVEGDITTILCGASRPTHFRGVTTVVNMLFNIVEPDRAYFGLKDAQQAAIITKMVEDLHMNVSIVVCPIVREDDGLALSSRNTYLNKEERDQATILSKSLKLALDLYLKGEINPKKLEEIIINKIESMPLAIIDYVKVYSFPSLTEIDEIIDTAIAAVAVKFGKTRLIDNILLKKQ